MNYIFDFGNVLARFDPKLLTAVYVENPEDIETVSTVVFDRLYWDRLDKGTIEDEEVKSEIKKRLPSHLGEVACKVYDNWINNLTPIDGMREIVKDIRKGGEKLYLLSSISKGFALGYKLVPWIRDLFSLFDGLVFSGPLGIVKPDREIFEYVLNKYSLKAEECMFIDDSPINTEGASALGIKTYLFDGDSTKLRKLINIGV